MWSISVRGLDDDRVRRVRWLRWVQQRVHRSSKITREDNDAISDVHRGGRGPEDVAGITQHNPQTVGDVGGHVIGNGAQETKRTLDVSVVVERQWRIVPRVAATPGVGGFLLLQVR